MASTVAHIVYGPGKNGSATIFHNIIPDENFNLVVDKYSINEVTRNINVFHMHGYSDMEGIIEQVVQMGGSVKLYLPIREDIVMQAISMLFQFLRFPQGMVGSYLKEIYPSLESTTELTVKDMESMFRSPLIPINLFVYQLVQIITILHNLFDFLGFEESYLLGVKENGYCIRACSKLGEKGEVLILRTAKISELNKTISDFSQGKYIYTKSHNVTTDFWSDKYSSFVGSFVLSDWEKEFVQMCYGSKYIRFMLDKAYCRYL